MSPRCVNPGQGELLAGYELGLLPAGDAVAFEAHLLRCPACEEAVYEMSPHTVALRDEAGRLAERLEAATAAPRPTPAPRRALALPASARLREALAAAVAAVKPRLALPATLAAVAVVALLLFLPRGEPGWREFARIEPLPYVPLETRDVGAFGFERAMDLYARGRYRAAAATLREIVEAESPEATDTAGKEPRAPAAPPSAGGAASAKLDQARLYLGICLLLEDDARRAAPHLERASRSSLPVLADRARWFLAQADLLLGRPEDAESRLRELAERSPGYGQVARDQLEELSARRQRRSRE